MARCWHGSIFNRWKNWLATCLSICGCCQWRRSMLYSWYSYFVLNVITCTVLFMRFGWCHCKHCWEKLHLFSRWICFHNCQCKNKDGHTSSRLKAWFDFVNSLVYCMLYSDAECVICKWKKLAIQENRALLKVSWYLFI